MVKKVAKRCGIFLLLLWVFALSVSAAEADMAPESATVTEEWQGFLDAIPPEIAELLPKGFFSKDPEGAGEAVAEAGSFSAIFDTVLRLTGLSIKEAAGLFARICGVLVLAAVLRSLTEGKGDGTYRAAALCTTAVLALLILRQQRGKMAEIGAYFDTVRGLSVALLPLMGALYAMGGNVSTAVAHHGMMSLFLTVLESVCSTTALPLAGICLAMALLDSVSDGLSLRSLAGLIKRTYTFGLSLVMLLLCGVLGLQSTLGKGADTLALRTIRFAVGSFLPVVGGSVSESLRTVAGSVAYLRTTVGVGGILVLFFAFLPLFLSVLFTRLAFLLGGSVAGMLSCSREERLLSELAGVYGYFMAIIACLFVTVSFSLTILAHCAAAI
ncbi:MAG: hypothetical protein IJY16_00545 [Clostridia bacterium]|nr:hypothetical protein [Clostridia bacterium]